VWGCGNEKRDFRVHELNPRIQQVDQERARLGGLLRLSRIHRQSDAHVLRIQLGQVGAAMRRIATLDPPEGAEKRFRSYVRANAALLAALSRFIDALATGTGAERRKGGSDIKSALSRANRAQVALQHALR
jgi:hypothetical protein